MSETVTVAIGANVYAALKAMADKEGLEPEMLLEAFIAHKYSQSLQVKAKPDALTGTFGEPLDHA